MAGASRELQMTLQSAYQEAVHRRHAYVTLEHLLFALLHDERGVEIISSCGGNIEALKQDLERFFQDDLEKALTLDDRAGEVAFAQLRELEQKKIESRLTERVDLFAVALRLVGVPVVKHVAAQNEALWIRIFVVPAQALRQRQREPAPFGLPGREALRQVGLVEPGRERAAILEMAAEALDDRPGVLRLEWC